MAQQKSIVSLVGTLDGINFYTLKGKPVARKAGGGFNGAKIKTSPTMVRVRESNTEFGHCSRFKKVFKNALHPFFKDYKNGALHGRMMRLFLGIKDCDLLSERGKRTIANGFLSEMGRHLLVQFRFTDFSLPFLQGTYNTADSSFSLQGFSPSLLPFPSGATHLVIDYGVVAVSATFSQAVLESSTVSVLLDATAPFNGVIFPIATPLASSETRIGVLTYRFVQELNGMVYPLKDASYFGLQVVGITF